MAQRLHIRTARCPVSGIDTDDDTFASGFLRRQVQHCCSGIDLRMIRIFPCGIQGDLLQVGVFHRLHLWCDICRSLWCHTLRNHSFYNFCILYGLCALHGICVLHGICALHAFRTPGIFLCSTGSQGKRQRHNGYSRCHSVLFSVKHLSFTPPI